MTPAQKRAYVLADNKLALNAGWDEDLFAEELQALVGIDDLDFDIGVTGFELGEIDTLITGLDVEEPGDPEDDVVPGEVPRRVHPGDIWQLGRHRLVCGDALDPAVVASLMRGETARMVFSDPPFNVKIDGHVSASGKIKHRAFAMASGEMNEMLAAGQGVYDELKNLIVWVKDNGGMGTFYRSRHELIFAFKKGSAPHVNTFELGQHGRYRTNVWQYRGVNTMRAGRMDELALHPTVRPVQMIADAIRDVFGGSGSTLIAAEKTGRRGFLVELDPIYCDRILTRWEAFAKDAAERQVCGWPQSVERLEAAI